MKPPSSIPGLPYRADIDGLRAIAVLAVIGYHAKLPGFSGGYVGVDVFFVISGYLITLQLLRLLDTGGWRALGEFYLRRARRILPALYVVLGVSAALACWLFFPQDLMRFGRSLAWAAAFLGNVGAWRDGGYFDAGERFTPLRHLWSIGVEEQFYVLYPLGLLLLLRGSAAARRGWVLFALVLSLGGALLAKDHQPILNFYLLPSRAWELLAGALAALSPLPVRTPAVARQLLAAFAFATLLGVVAYNRVIGFPSTASVLTCASAIALLTVSPGTWIGRLLQYRALVFTGLISYSLYLWHAPVLAFASYQRIDEPGGGELAATLAGIYALAVASWALIEQPLRRQPLSALRPLLLRGAVPLALGLIFLGGFLTRTGLAQRFDGDPVSVPGDASAQLGASCLDASPARIHAGALCSFGPAAASTRVLVWGDSHAYALLPLYRELAEQRHIRIFYGVMGACWPLLGAEAASAGEFWRARCARFNAAMAEAVARLRPERVILNAYWLDPGVALEGPFQRRQADEAALEAGLARTLQAVGAAGGRVCAVLTVPGYAYPLPYALAMARREGHDVDTLGAPREQAYAQAARVEAVLRARADAGELRVVDPKAALCTGPRCQILSPDGTPLYRDGSHLSVAGGLRIEATIAGCLDAAPGVR